MSRRAPKEGAGGLRNTRGYFLSQCLSFLSICFPAVNKIRLKPTWILFKI